MRSMNMMMFHWWISSFLVLMVMSAALAESDETCDCNDCYASNGAFVNQIMELQERVVCLEDAVDQLQQFQDEPQYIRGKLK